ncbi:hypothetical protein BVRB_016540, partial [Beta vulgaris subsp. vulgaris]
MYPGLMAPTIWESVTLRIWHGGRFSYDRQGVMVYVGGQGRTLQIRPDELCYWDLLNLAKESGPYETVHGVFYQVPGLDMQQGLRKVVDDKDVREMAEITIKNRAVHLYVLHQESDPNLGPLGEPKIVDQPVRPKKLTPKQGPITKLSTPARSSPRLKEPTNNQKSVLEHPTNNQKSVPQNLTNTDVPPFVPQKLTNNDVYDTVDQRPESPIPYRDLFSDSEDSEDPLYEPDSGWTSGDNGAQSGVAEEEYDDGDEYDEGGEYDEGDEDETVVEFE